MLLGGVRCSGVVQAMAACVIEQIKAFSLIHRIKNYFTQIISHYLSNWKHTKKFCQEKMFTDSSDEDDETVYESPKPITHGAVKLSRKLELTLKGTLHRRQQLPLTTSHATPRATVTNSKKSGAKKPFRITPGSKHPSALQRWYPIPKMKPPIGYKFACDYTCPSPPPALRKYRTSSKMDNKKANGPSWMKRDIIDKQGVMLTRGKDVHYAIQSNETGSASFIKLSSNLTKCIDLTEKTRTASVTTSKFVIKSPPTSRLHGHVSKTSSNSAYQVVKSERTLPTVVSGELKPVGTMKTIPKPVCLKHIPAPIRCPGCDQPKCINMVVLNGAWYNGRHWYLGDRIYNRTDDICGNKNRIERFQQIYGALAGERNFTTTCFVLFCQRYFPLVLKSPPSCQPSSSFSNDDDNDDNDDDNLSDSLIFYGQRNK